MSQNSDKNIIVYNYFYILNKDQNQFENIESLISSSTLFKPIKNCFIKKSNLKETIQKKEIPQSKLIINNEYDEKKINFEVNGNNIDKYNYNISSIDNTKDITIEISGDEDNNKFLSKKRFLLINTRNKIGRLPKNSLYIGYHTKFSHDNILRKVRVKFFHKLINYINSIILSKYRNIPVLKPLKGKVSQDNTIDFNKKLLNTKLKDIFLNYEINGKFKLYEKFYNKKIIEKIYEENIQELIDILEITFLDAFNIFRNKIKDQKLNGLEKIDTVLEDIKLKENDEEYINKFREIVMNFEKYYFNRD